VRVLARSARETFPDAGNIEKVLEILPKSTSIKSQPLATKPRNYRAFLRRTYRLRVRFAPVQVPKPIPDRLSLLL
jgi:hypothetical protein